MGAADIIAGSGERSAESLHEYEQPLNFFRYAPVPLQFYNEAGSVAARYFLTRNGKIIVQFTTLLT